MEVTQMSDSNYTVYPRNKFLGLSKFGFPDMALDDTFKIPLNKLNTYSLGRAKNIAKAFLMYFVLKDTILESIAIFLPVSANILFTNSDNHFI